MEVTPGIHLVDGVYGNCYVIAAGELALVNTGLPWQSGRIISYIRRTLHRNPGEIKTIILTHCDLDHTGSARRLRQLTGARVAAHRIEAEYLAGRKLRLGAPGSNRAMNALYRFAAVSLKWEGILPVTTDLLLEEGDLISGLRVIHTPGHTPGSLALYEPNARVLFSGDTLVYQSGRLHGSPSHLAMEPEALRASYRKLLALDFDILLGGHGQPLKPEAGARARQMFGLTS